jgi:putative FmdB family regulatory protein
MPIFEYVCTDCDHRFETIVRGTASPTCPACHGDKLSKQLSVFAVGAKEATTGTGVTPCGTCGDPRGAGSCSMN